MNPEVYIIHDSDSEPEIESAPINSALPAVRLPALIEEARFYDDGIWYDVLGDGTDELDEVGFRDLPPLNFKYTPFQPSSKPEVNLDLEQRIKRFCLDAVVPTSDGSTTPDTNSPPNIPTSNHKRAEFTNENFDAESKSPDESMIPIEQVNNAVDENSTSKLCDAQDSPNISPYHELSKIPYIIKCCWQTRWRKCKDLTPCASAHKRFQLFFTLNLGAGRNLPKLLLEALKIESDPCTVDPTSAYIAASAVTEEPCTILVPVKPEMARAMLPPDRFNIISELVAESERNNEEASIRAAEKTPPKDETPNIKSVSLPEMLSERPGLLPSRLNQIIATKSDDNKIRIVRKIVLPVKTMDSIVPPEEPADTLVPDCPKKGIHKKVTDTKDEDESPVQESDITAEPPAKRRSTTTGDNILNDGSRSSEAARSEPVPEWGAICTSIPELGYVVMGKVGSRLQVCDRSVASQPISFLNIHELKRFLNSQLATNLNSKRKKDDLEWIVVNSGYLKQKSLSRTDPHLWMNPTAAVRTQKAAKDYIRRLNYIKLQENKRRALEKKANSSIGRPNRPVENPFPAVFNPAARAVTTSPGGIVAGTSLPPGEVVPATQGPPYAATVLTSAKAIPRSAGRLVVPVSRNLVPAATVFSPTSKSSSIAKLLTKCGPGASTSSAVPAPPRKSSLLSSSISLPKPPARSTSRTTSSVGSPPNPVVSMTLNPSGKPSPFPCKIVVTPPETPIAATTTTTTTTTTTRTPVSTTPSYTRPNILRPKHRVILIRKGAPAQSRPTHPIQDLLRNKLP